MVRFTVEAGHVMQFARAIGDESPQFYGALDGVMSGVPAPPTFLQAVAHYDPEYRLRPYPGRPWPPERPQQRVLHAEQHVEYRRPVVSGDVLTVMRTPGRTWEKQGRSGSLLFTETVTEYRDDTGELVATVRAVSVTTAAGAST